MDENDKVLYLSADEFEQLEAALSAPPKANPKLAALLARDDYFPY